jgi:hypothetical protein
MIPVTPMMKKTMKMKTPTNHTKTSNKKSNKKVHWKTLFVSEILENTATMIQTANDLLKFMCHKSLKRGESVLTSQQLLMESYKPFAAMKIASSPDKINPAKDISVDLKINVEREKSQARDAIAHEINQVRQANMRIDKMMASNMHSFPVFWLSPDLPGTISIFHCFPRQPGELTDIISGEEELDMKVKMKVISGDDVKGYFETKLAIASTAHELAKQLFNFWQYVSFQFRDDSWLANQVKEIYTIILKHENDIQSIMNTQKKFIPLLASKINSNFHQTLNSCMQASGDTTLVNWKLVENLLAKLQGYINDREKPNFIMTWMIKKMLGIDNNHNQDDSDLEDDCDEHIGSGNKCQCYIKGNEHEKHGPVAKGRNDDADKINPNVCKAWKMSQKEFHQIISLLSGSCPKQDGKPLCASFIIMGRCGYGQSRCQRVHSGLSREAIKKMSEWIKNCRAKADEKKKKKNEEIDEGDDI